MIALLGADPATYERHAIHADGRVYEETNCYTDVVVELVHAHGLEPLAMLGHLARQDFEGDQFTFFKPPPGDLERLYGIDVHEMNPWRPLPEQAAEQLARGRTLLVELDAFHLPDVAGTDYRVNHVKTTVAIEAIDPAAHRLVYWHNTGLYALDGDDYAGAFRLGDGWSPDVLPPYAELVRFDAGAPLAGEALREAARELLARHLRRRPAANPLQAFGSRLAADLPGLVDGGVAAFHAYAFPTVRMAGASFELLGDHVRWLAGETAADAPLAAVVDACKLLSFRLARRRAFEPGPIVAQAADGWERAMAALDDLVA